MRAGRISMRQGISVMGQAEVGSVRKFLARVWRANVPVAFAALLTPAMACAADSVLGGEFDGSEPRTANLPGNCSIPGQLPYQQVPFQVTASGGYHMFDAYNLNGMDVTALVYQESFNQGSPQLNLQTPLGVDVADMVTLNAGVAYVLVVQQWCQAREGAWAVTLAGPGSVNSPNLRNVPAFTSGTFSGSDPTLNGACGNTQYQQAGPIQVSRTGTYYYTDISIAHAVDMCLQIYTAPVNTGNPAQNRLAAFDDFGQVTLQAGQNYYFVSQPLDDPQTGAYFFVFSPPAQFRMNAGLAGSWFNPLTAGQGFFLDVFDNLNQVFLAWFTYDLQRPEGSAAAGIGDPGHRWLTAFGPFSGNSAALDIEWTVGGVFDAGQPEPTQLVDGSIDLDFTDCMSGLVTYDLGSAGITDSVPIQRLASDGIALCESLYQGPGMPGPL
jgi:hypothetical protein